MSVDDEYVSTLTELGLTNLQAKVYLSLAKSKQLKAQEISNAAGIARPDVYRVLTELQKAGLIERIIAKPERFHAVSIEECVSSLMQKRIRKTGELQQKTQSLARNFRRSVESEEPEAGFQFTLIPERAALYSKAEKLVKNVRTSADFLGLRKKMVAWLLTYQSLLEKALSRNVACRMIMPEDEILRLDENLKNLQKHSNFLLRGVAKEPKAGFSIWDKKEILINTSAADTPSAHTSLWSNNKAIVDLSQDYFEHVWKEANKPERT
jgi:sugar-specific transcriptional regulator TrmB